MHLALRSNRKAWTFLIVGLLSLVLSVGSQALSLTFGLAPGPLHFLRGFFLGGSLVFIMTAAVLTGRQRPQN
jgi:hypothetical protein